MRNLRVAGILCLAVLALTSCSKTSKSEIDPNTGMATFFCPVIKPDVEKANSDFWSLGKSTSIATFTESMLKLGPDINVAAALSREPAKGWLQALGNNGVDLITYFSSNNPGGSEDLLQRAMRWKATYLDLKKFCP